MKITGTPAPNEQIIPVLEIFMQSEKNCHIATCPSCNLVFISKGDDLCNYCNGYSAEKREINQRWYKENRDKYKEKQKDYRKKKKPYTPEYYRYYMKKRRATGGGGSCQFKREE